MLVFTDDTSDVGIADLILFCVKSYDTESAAESLRPMIGTDSAILSLQNGIDNAEKIARLWGEQRTLPVWSILALRSTRRVWFAIRPARKSSSANRISVLTT